MYEMCLRKRERKTKTNAVLSTNYLFFQFSSNTNHSTLIHFYFVRLKNVTYPEAFVLHMMSFGLYRPYFNSKYKENNKEVPFACFFWCGTYSTKNRWLLFASSFFFIKVGSFKNISIAHTCVLTFDNFVGQ